MPKRLNLAGEKFGRLRVLRYYSPSSQGAVWRCVCDCGVFVHTTSARLMSGKIKSCGCFRRDRTAELHRTHGMRHTREYETWIRMRTRCLCPTNFRWKYYGGRGISICDRWSAFSNFHADMGKRPIGKSLDRIDNNGNYSPENCRWATQAEQRRNSSTAVLITHNGETLCASDWALRLGMNRQKISKWVRRGMPLATLITEAKRI